MAKSTKNIVRDILRAQGIWEDPKPETIKAYEDAVHDVYSEATRDAEYDAQMQRNFES